MSSSKPKPLMLAKSLAELNEKTAVSPSIFELSIKPKCNTAIKIFKDAEKFRKEEDEEKAYVYYKRYSYLVQNIIKMPEYKEHKKFYEDLLGKNNVKTADKWMKKLSETLATRYKLKLQDSECPKEINKTVIRTTQPLARIHSQPTSIKESVLAEECLKSLKESFADESNKAEKENSQMSRHLRKISRSRSCPTIEQVIKESNDSNDKATNDKKVVSLVDEAPNKTTEEATQTSMLTGLNNLGCTDFINCVLQCLAQTTNFANYFTTDMYKLHLNTYQRNNAELKEFALLIKNLTDEQQTVFTPKEFIKLVRKRHPKFEGFNYGDSAEFLVFLLDVLHEDLNGVKHRSAPSSYQPILTEDISEDEAANLFWSDHNKFNKSYIASLFQGQYKSTFHCLSCNRNSIDFNVSWHLSLPIPLKTDACILKDCLDLYKQEKKISIENDWFCPKCKTISEATKTSMIWKLPPILIIHLQRFVFEGRRRVKLKTKIEFPVKESCLKEYIIGPKKPTTSYSLYAIANHNGTVENGYYSASCKCTKDNRWYKIHDNNISDIGRFDFKSSSAYMLFYSSMKPLASNVQPVTTPTQPRTFV